jgi:putative OPT family oligopeptide transporter
MSDVSAAAPRKELTLRGLILGAALTLVFTAANVYFGLKAGLTFASSIPAAVISMAALRAVRGATIQENNIVQTIASAAGAIASVIFVLPGLVMIGWWKGFPFWETFGLCAAGGVLGVTYSIPLRRALVTGSDLPYPEGVACAEVLKVGSQDAAPEAAAEGRAGALAVLFGGLVSAVFALAAATRVLTSDIAAYARFGRSATGFDFGMSLALFGVGHLIGLWSGIAMLLGLVIAWGVAVPVLTALHPAAGPAADLALGVWSHDVRFIGAGAMGVAAIWTLLKLVRPIAAGMAAAMAASRARSSGRGALLPRTEQDMPVTWVGLISLVCLVPIGWLFVAFARQGGLGAFTGELLAGGLLYVLVMSAFVAAVCGYMAGLVGSSNSPVSGVGILAAIIAALLLVPLAAGAGAHATDALVAFALFATATVFAAAIVANDNLQDLKTGQLVDSTPWKQQAALIVGVVIGAAVIPPLLDLLNLAYGFAGAPGADPARALPAPQATLISALAKGVLQGDLDWSLIGAGAGLGVVIVMFDELLRVIKRPRCAPLAVGLGIYLPMSVTALIIVGAISGHIFDRRAQRRAGGEAVKRLGVLAASGLIVGESLMGIALAGLVVGTGKAAPLALVGDRFAPIAIPVTAVAFVLAVLALYRWAARRPFSSQ